MFDDSVVEEVWTQGLASELDSLFPSRSTETETTHAWSGILCDSVDKLPIVGAIKEMQGQYVSVGYTGQGMVKAFSCGRHIAELIGKVKLSCPLIDEQYSPDRF